MAPTSIPGVPSCEGPGRLRFHLSTPPPPPPPNILAHHSLHHSSADDGFTGEETRACNPRDGINFPCNFSFLLLPSSSSSDAALRPPVCSGSSQARGSTASRTPSVSASLTSQSSPRAVPMTSGTRRNCRPPWTWGNHGMFPGCASDLLSVGVAKGA